METRQDGIKSTRSADMINTFNGESQLFFANKDDIDFKPIKVINNPVLAPETPIAFAPSEPYSCSFKLSKDAWKFLFWQDRPSNLKYFYKNRKWRVKKKWFNRYEKPRLIGGKIRAEERDAIVTNVTLRKGGGHYSTFTYTLEFT